jgi:hypothetical protein
MTISSKNLSTNRARSKLQFSEQFQHFVPPSQDLVKKGITEELVVLDSNVLLSAYRFAPKPRDELLGVLELLGDRLWVPHQVGLEFHRNRLSVIADHDAAYKGAIDALTKHRDELLPGLQQKIQELANRVSLNDKERTGLLSLLGSSFDQLSSHLDDLRRAHGVGKPTDPDQILAKIADVLSDKIGAPLDAENDASERAEAARRVREKHPPGYRDSSKDEPHGDYFVWCQTLR